MERPSALVLFGSPADIGTEESWEMSTWQFVVKPGPGGSSRPLTRVAPTTPQIGRATSRLDASPSK